MQRHGISKLWRFRSWRAAFPQRTKHQHDHRHVSTAAHPFRLAIIGSGPAGFYTAAKVMSRIEGAKVDMYEQLPVPFGLVRFGVAPDHPEVKNCQDRFSEVASSPNFDFIGNVEVGRDVSLVDLRDRYSTVLFAYGASKDRLLGLDGESHLSGLYSARAFVGWYNGLPEFTDLKPDLDSDDTAVIIGQGNVALDVARVLLSDVESLRKTDISAHALEALSRSRIKRVHICGRRGPMQASFTIKELRELLALQNTEFKGIMESRALPIGLDLKLPRAQKRMADLLIKHVRPPQIPRRPNGENIKRWSLDFFANPEQLHTHHGDRIDGISFQRTKFVSGADPFNPKARVELIDKSGLGDSSSGFRIDAHCCFRSIGYKAEPLEGMDECDIPFDTKTGTIVCDDGGRVLSAARRRNDANGQETLKGMYCAGWVKSGPTGVIAASMEDAFATAGSIVDDWEGQGKTGHPRPGRADGWDALLGEVERKGVRRVSWKDWMKIDEVERTQGEKKGKPREKFVRVEDMLKVLD